MHACQQSLTVSHVVSLTVPKAAPAGTNPFDEDDDEVGETAVEQEITVNNTVVNKEEIKTLVNRKRSPAAFSVSTFAMWSVVGVASHAFSFSWFLSTTFYSLLPQVSCCGSAWSLNGIAHKACVFSSSLTVSCLAER